MRAKHPASPVPRSRFERLAHLGGLAGRVAGGMLAEGMRQVARGNLPSTADLVLTPANARRVSEKLSELRGAAIKVQQPVEQTRKTRKYFRNAVGYLIALTANPVVVHRPASQSGQTPHNG